MRDIFLCYLLALATAIAVGWVMLVRKAADSRSAAFGCVSVIAGALMVCLVVCILAFVAHQAGISMAGFLGG